MSSDQSCLGYTVFRPGRAPRWKGCRQIPVGNGIEKRGFLRRRYFVLPTMYAVLRHDECAVRSTISRRGLALVAKPPSPQALSEDKGR